MINIDEIKKISTESGIPITCIEKDYVMGWLLWAIYNETLLSKNLVLKGGNCLRKIYFSDTRFSDDLDFTADRIDTADEFKKQLQNICKRVEDIAGIKFNMDDTNVKLTDIYGKELQALDGRVYFKGFAGDSNITMKIKFDISEYEKIVLPLQTHSIIHPFSDASICKANILAYSLEEILAEKLRSWIQRTRPRDLFDVVKIIQSKAIPISKKNILSAFFHKTIFKDIPIAGRDELLSDIKFNIIETHWDNAIICPSQSLIVAKNAITFFKDFVSALFQPEVVNSIGVYFNNMRTSSISAKMRETIIAAGKEHKVLRMRYDNKERDIEPYSFRYKNGSELFYGFDKTRGNIIKSYTLHKIQNISISPNLYEPRWSVEF